MREVIQNKKHIKVMNGNTLTSSAVSHPPYYNQHPAGIECIDIIRHYTCDIANTLKYLWRAGLKTEMGKEDAEKEIEDLKKALWYIEDYRKHVNKRSTYTLVKAAKNAKQFGITDKAVCEAQVGLNTGYELEQIVKGYDKHIADAMWQLLQIGLISDEGKIYMPRTWRSMLDVAIKHIQDRILDIERQLTNKELQSTIEAVDVHKEHELELKQLEEELNKED